MLTNLVSSYPNRMGYAKMVAERLTEKGFPTKTETVYQIGAGNSYNPRIAWELMVLYRALRLHDFKMKQELERLIEV